jgi:hypothetical protein
MFRRLFAYAVCWQERQRRMPSIQLLVKSTETYCCNMAPVPGQKTEKQPTKVKLTVSLSRSAVAALDRISAKRLEAGAGRRQVQQSAIIEEAIQSLRQKEGV